MKSGLRLLVAPRSPAGVLARVGVAGLVATAIVGAVWQPGRASVGYEALGGVAIFLLALLLLAALVWLFEELKQQYTGAEAITLIPLGLVVCAGFPMFLVWLVSQGIDTGPSAYISNTNWLGLLQYALLFGVFGCAFIAPGMLRDRLEFDNASEEARRIVPAVLTAGALLAAAAYVVSTHFHGGATATVPWGPLMAATMAAVALLAPGTKSLVILAWRRGLKNTFAINDYLKVLKAVRMELAAGSNPERQKPGAGRYTPPRERLVTADEPVDGRPN